MPHVRHKGSFHQLLILFYLVSTTLGVPIDFQVGNYLHKFFKDFLPNNTNYRRKPGDEAPYRKYYTQKQISTSQLPTIEGLTFKYAQNEFPTLPMHYGNATFGTYKFRMESTFGTTPSKENLLKMGAVFRDILMQKTGLLKALAGEFKEAVQQNSTACSDYRDVEKDYDARLAQVLGNVKVKMDKRVEAHYNQSTTEVTAGIYNNFIAEFKAAYEKQVNAIADKSTLTAQPSDANRTTTGLFKLRESQEARDKEALARLEELEEEFVTKADFEEALKDIITPGSRENR